MKQTRDFALLLLAAVLVVPVSWAQDTDEEGRGVARISVLNGDVTMRRGDGDDLIAAAINAPLVVPDTLYTGTASRAEVQLDWANLVRLSSNAEVKFSELEYQKFQIQVARGTVTYSVLRDSKSDVDLATPNVSVRPLAQGRYRVTVHGDGTTEVTVRSGEAEIYTPQGVEHLKSGKSMLVRGTLGSPEFQIASAPPKDEWDHWNEQRDKELKRSVSYNYVSPSVYGAEDLDGYGSWVHDPGYGWVWAPSVSAGWAPYRYGRWSWVDWYGWSWVSYDPWGWAPYHYGRWYNRPGRGWCWWPGGIGVRHHWSPGLVAFFGWGSHSGFSAGISIGFGHVGWVPLAPYERYHRWYGNGYYGGHRGGNNRTYIDNSVNITNIYQNARHHNGVTAVDGREFGRGHVRNTYRGDSATLRNANLVRGQVPVVPQQESRRFASRDINRSTVSSRANGVTAYTRRTPGQTDRVSFADQQRGMERVVERTSGRGGTTRGGQTAAAGGAAATRSARNSSVTGQGTSTPGATRSQSPSGNRGAAASPSGLTPRSARDANQQSGWKRDPDSGSSQTQRTTGGSSQGWTSFGQPTQTQRTARGSGNSSAASQNQSSAGRSAAPAASRSNRGNSGGWTRFGEPGGSPAAASRSGSRASGSGSSSPSGTVRRSNSSSSPSAARGGSSSSSRSATPSPVNRGGVGSAPSSSQSSGSVGRSSGSSSRSSSSRESIRVRPPIVQPRSSPSSSPRVYGGSSGSSSSGSVGRSNRSSGGYSPPSRSAPSPSRSSGPSMRSAPSPGRSAPSGSGASSGGRSGGSSGRSSSGGGSGRGGRR